MKDAGNGRWRKHSHPYQYPEIQWSCIDPRYQYGSITNRTTVLMFRAGLNLLQKEPSARSQRTPPKPAGSRLDQEEKHKRMIEGDEINRSITVHLIDDGYRNPH